MAGKEMEDPGSHFSTVLVAAAKLPGVRINRETYLRKALSRHCSEEQIKQAIEETPAAAGIPLDILEKAANDSIKYETAKVSAASAAAGLPGPCSSFPPPSPPTWRSTWVTCCASRRSSPTSTVGPTCSPATTWTTRPRECSHSSSA
ncbi:hypothetical protein GCM10023238_29780 [Streptomyces heliomycini]